jgi:hypothetical protein
MKDGSAPDHHPLPLFLIERADAAAQQGSSRLFKTALLVLAVSAIGAGIVTFADPLTRLAAVTASPVDVSAPQPDNPQQPATIQSAADIQAPLASQPAADVQPPPAAAADMPVRQDSPQGAAQQTPQQTPPDTPQDVAAAGTEPAGRPQAQTSEASEALFRQFQAWSRDQDSRQATQAASAQPAEPAGAKRAQAARESSAKVDSEDRAPVRTAKRHRRVRALQNARAEMRSARQARARAARERGAELRARPAEDARAQQQPVQNPQPSPLSQFFGWQN